MPRDAFLLDKGFTTLDDEGLASFGWGVVRVGATRDFGCSGGFAAILVSLGGLVIAPAVVELGEFVLSDLQRNAFFWRNRSTILDVERPARIGWSVVRVDATRDFGRSGGFAAILVSVGGTGILSACVGPKEFCFAAVLGSAFFFDTGFPKLEHEAVPFREVGTSVETALTDDLSRSREAETSVAAASAKETFLTMFLGFLGIGIAPLCVKLDGV